MSGHLNRGATSSVVCIIGALGATVQTIKEVPMQVVWWLDLQILQTSRASIVL
jgi:hypothetical protein